MGGKGAFSSHTSQVAIKARPSHSLLLMPDTERLAGVSSLAPLALLPTLRLYDPELLARHQRTLLVPDALPAHRLDLLHCLKRRQDGTAALRERKLSCLLIEQLEKQHAQKLGEKIYHGPAPHVKSKFSPCLVQRPSISEKRVRSHLREIDLACGSSSNNKTLLSTSNGDICASATGILCLTSQ